MLKNFPKNGYTSDLKELDVRVAMRIFCVRRSSVIVKEFQQNLRMEDLIARVYYQGLQDGMNLNNTPSR